MKQSSTRFHVYLVNVKSSGRLFQIFVAFSECPNFNSDGKKKSLIVLLWILTKFWIQLTKPAILDRILIEIIKIFQICLSAVLALASCEPFLTSGPAAGPVHAAIGGLVATKRGYRVSFTKSFFFYLLITFCFLFFITNNLIREMVFCSSDREKLLKFKSERQEFGNILRSLEQLIQTVKSQNNFW